MEWSEDEMHEVLRRAADKFAMTVFLVAQKTGREIPELAAEALADSTSRISEQGLINWDITTND